MRSSGPLRSVTALCLLVLLGALGTGLPSHAHPRGNGLADPDSHIVDVDHHSHSTQLVDQDHRAPSGGQQVAVVAAVVVAFEPPVGPVVEADDTHVLRPMQRAPPPGAPRAPPFVA